MAENPSIESLDEFLGGIDLRMTFSTVVHRILPR
jgi:hypothetical protein